MSRRHRMPTSKALILVRHAKSSWTDTSLADLDRPLNSRGQRDAPRMGLHLARRGVRPQLMVSSPALRALTTAQIIAAEIGLRPADITVDERVYTSDAAALTGVIQGLDDRFDRVMIVGHNPTLTDLVNRLAGATIQNIPTCGVVALRVAVDRWSALPGARIELLWFDVPKALPDRGPDAGTRP